MRLVSTIDLWARLAPTVVAINIAAGGAIACGTSESLIDADGSARGSDSAASLYPEWVVRGPYISRESGVTIHGVGADVGGRSPIADEDARNDVQNTLETYMTSVLRGGCTGPWPGAVGTETSPEGQKWMAAERKIEANIQSARRYSRVTDRYRHSDGTIYARAEMDVGPLFDEMATLGEPGELLVELATERLDRLCPSELCPEGGAANQAVAPPQELPLPAVHPKQ